MLIFDNFCIYLSILDPPDFATNLDLKYMTDGVRCGPKHFCMNQSCVSVPIIPDRCWLCPGSLGSCDQNYTCYCDEKLYGKTACRYGTYMPPNPGMIGPLTYDTHELIGWIGELLSRSFYWCHVTHKSSASIHNLVLITIDS